MENAIKEKLNTVIELVNNVMVNPDVEVEYCQPGGDPCIHLKYNANGTHLMEQDIPIRHHYLDKTPEDTSDDWKWYHYLLAGTTTFLFSVAFIMLITKRRRR